MCGVWILLKKKKILLTHFIVLTKKKFPFYLKKNDFDFFLDEWCKSSSSNNLYEKYWKNNACLQLLLLPYIIILYLCWYMNCAMIIFFPLPYTPKKCLKVILLPYPNKQNQISENYLVKLQKTTFPSLLHLLNFMNLNFPAFL